MCKLFSSHLLFFVVPSALEYKRRENRKEHVSRSQQNAAPLTRHPQSAFNQNTSLKRQIYIRTNISISQTIWHLNTRFTSFIFPSHLLDTTKGQGTGKNMFTIMRFHYNYWDSYSSGQGRRILVVILRTLLHRGSLNWSSTVLYSACMEQWYQQLTSISKQKAWSKRTKSKYQICKHKK